MTEIRRVLAATDFSADADSAMARAALVAGEQGATLELLHVVRAAELAGLRALGHAPEDLEAKVLQQEQNQLEQRRAALAAQASVPVTARLVQGVPQLELLNACEEVDLLVVGAHGTSPLRDLLLGSTAERILRKIRIPMLVVRRPPVGPYQCVLVPTDFSACAEAAIGAAERIAPGAQLTAAHAYDVPFEGYLLLAGASEEKIETLRAEALGEATARLAAQVERAAPSGGRWRQKVARGDPAPVILEMVQHLQPDLVAIGKHGTSLLEEVLIGSVTRRILAKVGCDVLVMPPTI